MNALAAKKRKVQGLRRRWLTGSMGPVLVILLLVGVLISVGFASNYYNSARSTLPALLRNCSSMRSLSSKAAA